MVMSLSDANILLFFWLWRMPWASAQDLAEVLSATADPAHQMTASAITEVMKRHPSWVRRYKVGRKDQMVLRHVLLPEGVAKLEKAFGWQPQWWHTAAGQQLLFWRLAFLELCYKILPKMLRAEESRMINSADVPAICPGPNDDIATVDYTEGVLKDLQWCQDSVVSLVATYEVAGSPADIFLPVVYYSSYRRPSDIASWEEELRQVLCGDIWAGFSDPGVDLLLDRGKLPYPLLVVVPNEVVGAKALAREAWQEGFNLGIIDLKQNVVRLFNGLAFRWSRMPVGPRPADLGDHRQVDTLVTKSYWSSLLGPLEWSFMCWIHDYQGSTLEQVRAGCKIGKRRGEKILSRFKDLDLVMVDGDQIYLGAKGYIVYSEAEGCHVNRVRGRQDALLTNPQYRQDHAEHNWETAEAAVMAGAEGMAAYSGVHAVWDYPQYGTEVKPDIYVKVRVSPFSSRPELLVSLTLEDEEWLAADDTLAILVSLEVERRAGYVAPVEDKLRPYKILAQNGVAVPMALVTRSEAVVKTFLREGDNLPILGTTWEHMKALGFRMCWGTDRYLDRYPPTDPRDPAYEQYVDFVNGIGHYAVDCNNRDWELLLHWKYGS